MSEVFKISSTSELLLPAKKIISLLKDHKIVVFEGEIGSGKTTLIARICKLIEIPGISSPTFAIINTYSSKDLGEIYHFDLYRIKDEKEAILSGLEELIDSGNICFIEWPEKINNLLPNKYVRVVIKVKNNIRQITIST